MGWKIPVVEDQADEREALTIRLAASSYSVRHAVDGKTAMSQAPAEPPDLIVLDLGPPDYDGYAVMERLKGSPNTASIPIIVLTGRDQAINQLSAYELGAVDFFQKPVPCKWFSAAVERVQASRAKADKPSRAV